MSEATLSFSDHDQLRILFGAEDRFLRQVREAVGVDIVLRGDELRLHGDEDRIRRGVHVLEELHSIIQESGRLHPWEVDHVLRGGSAADRPEGHRPPPKDNGDGAEDSIDLFEKARRVVPRTEGQAQYVRTISENDLVFCAGPAGCGKTYLAVAMAVNALRSEQVRKIVLVRPAVEAGEKLGFLPGDLFAKVNPYLRPLLDALNDILDYEQVKRYMARDVIEIVPLAFMRGRTLNQTFIILDEAQNTTLTQMKMFLTRMGVESKIVVTGDTTQIDLPEHVSSGLIDAIARLAHIDGVGVVKLTGRDIVRHRLVREVVDAYDSANGKKPRRR